MSDLISATTATPTRKTQGAMVAGGAAMAASVVLGWVLRQFFPSIEVPAEVQVAVSVLITAGASYFTRERAA